MARTTDESLGELRFIRVTDRDVIRDLHHAAEELIPGYRAKGGLAVEEAKRALLEELFEGQGPAPAPTITLLATDTHQQSIYGGAILETPTHEELLEDDPDRARTLALTHRVLAALFVAPPAQGMGLGRHLLTEIAGEEVTRAGARWIDGFVDDRSGSRGFYEAIEEVQVFDNKDGLPSRYPAWIKMGEDPRVAGAWFCYDTLPARMHLMRCSRCGLPLRFQSAAHEAVECPSCGGPR